MYAPPEYSVPPEYSAPPEYKAPPEYNYVLSNSEKKWEIFVETD